MGITTFLVSGAGRWLLDELLGWLKLRDERAAIERAAQADHVRKREQAEWQLASVKATSDANIQVVRVQSEADALAAADRAFEAAVAATSTQVAGGKWAEVANAANALVRPTLAYWAIAMLSLESFGILTVGALAAEVASAALGVFVGGRIKHTGR